MFLINIHVTHFIARFGELVLFKHILTFLVECIKFCSMGILQKELDEVKKIHNTHRIRPFPNQECPNGKPEIIYGLPEIYGKWNFSKN